MKRDVVGNGEAHSEIEKAAKDFLAQDSFFQQFVGLDTEDGKLELLAQKAARSVSLHEFIIDKIYNNTDWEDPQSKKVLVEVLSRHARQLQNLCRLMRDRADHRRRELEETKEKVVHKVIEEIASGIMMAMTEAEIPPDIRKKVMAGLQEKVKYIEV